MAKIVLELDAPDPAVEAAVEALVQDELRKRLKGRIQTMICQQHARTPTVTVRGRVGSRFDYHVTGCCHDFVRRVKCRLEE